MSTELQLISQRRIEMVYKLRDNPNAAYPLWWLASDLGYPEYLFDSPNIRDNLNRIRALLHPDERIYTIPKSGFIIYSQCTDVGQTIQVHNFRPTPDFPSGTLMPQKIIEPAMVCLRRAYVATETTAFLYADNQTYKLNLLLMNSFGKGYVRAAVLKEQLGMNDSALYNAVQATIHMSNSMPEMPYTLTFQKGPGYALMLK